MEGEEYRTSWVNRGEKMWCAERVRGRESMMHRGCVELHLDERVRLPNATSRNGSKEVAVAESTLCDIIGRDGAGEDYGRLSWPANLTWPLPFDACRVFERGGNKAE